jgi:DNA-binding transcriptional MerR regulator/methylmalonyl-CoA mutase cobalamin-binding subunit
LADTYQRPIYNLSSVVRETGVKADTLRAWERRYGLPQPARTEGRQRLYSQRDVDTIKWLVARQREGLRIKRAVELWRSLEAAGQEPLQEMVPTLHPEELASDTVSELRQAWVSACLAFDERRAEQVLTQAFALYPPETVCLGLLRAGVAQIGQEWYEDHATVQQEHFATALAVRRVEALILAAPPPTRPGRLLIACPPEEEHCFGLLLLTYLLRRRGWDVIYLGANVPVARLEEATDTTQPSLVVSTALQLVTAANLLDMARFLQLQAIPLAFGGGIFEQVPALRARFPGHFLGAGLEQAPQAVEKILASSAPPPSVEPVPETAQRALVHYRERRLPIEAKLANQNPDLAGKDWFGTANRELARYLSAALALGDINLVDDSMGWLGGLGPGGDAISDTLNSYLSAYHQAARALLDGRGAPIIEWLARRNGADE